MLCKTGDGLSHAYVRLDIHERYVITLNSEVIYSTVSRMLNLLKEQLVMPRCAIYSLTACAATVSALFIMVTFSCFREITDISILEKFIHLRYVDLTKNLVKDLSPLNSLTQVSFSDKLSRFYKCYENVNLTLLINFFLSLTLNLLIQCSVCSADALSTSKSNIPT